MINKNDILTLEVIDYDMEGFGICKKDNFVLFVPKAILGETVEIIIVKVNKNFGYGKILNIPSESKNRSFKLCDNYATCGGCNLLHMKYSEQLNVKKHICYTTVKKITSIELNNLNIIPSTEYQYRNKVSVPFQKIDDKIIYGFYKNRTHEIVPLLNCFVQNEMNDKILTLVKNLLKEYNISIYDENTKKGDFKHVIIKNNKDYSEVMVVLIAKMKNDKFMDISNKMKEKFEFIKSIVLNINEIDNNVILGKENHVLYGKNYIIDKIGDLSFIIGAKSFYQVNSFQVENLYNKIIEIADLKKSDTVIDAYCGIGTITLFLAKKCKFVYGLEIVDEAVRNAELNKEMNKITNVQFLLGDVEKTILKVVNHTKINLIVLDPPRKGCSETFLKTLIDSNIEKIIYISCGVKGLAMDLNILKNYYTVKKYLCVDMFPQTSEVETIILLEKFR